MALPRPAEAARRRPPLRALNLGLHLEPGMRVGLYGGSFDPPHAGHLHVARTARLRLGLDRVVWLVTPGNPLKGAASADLARRLAAVRGLASAPAMAVSDAEARLGLRYTIDTVRALKARWPGVRFVWVMGADGLRDLHRWLGWADLMREVPIAVVSRPGWSVQAGLSVAARRFAFARLPAGAAHRLPSAQPPAWTVLQAPWNFASSTALRAMGPS